MIQMNASYGTRYCGSAMFGIFDIDESIHGNQSCDGDARPTFSQIRSGYYKISIPSYYRPFKTEYAGLLTI